MEGEYETGDFYVDNQYSDFFNAFVTMFIYLSTGENYVEAVGTALELPGGTFIYFLFFFVGSLLGTFFISSLLIDMFQANFLEKSDGELTKARRDKWNSVVITYEVWRRHSQGGWEGEPPRFDYPMFLDIMFQFNRGNKKANGPEQFNWLRTLRERLNYVAIMLLKRPAGLKAEMKVVCLLCAEFHFVDLYTLLRSQLCKFGVFYPASAAECRLWLNDRNIGTHITFTECERLRTKMRTTAGMSRKSGARGSMDNDAELDDEDYDFAETGFSDFIPPWHDLTEVNNVDNEVTHEVVLIAQLVTMHKWRLFELYKYVKKLNNSEGDEERIIHQKAATLSPNDFHRLMTLADLSFKLSDSKALRLDAMAMQIDREVDAVKEAIANGDDTIDIDRLGDEFGTRTGVDEMRNLQTFLEDEHDLTEEQIQQLTNDRTRLIREFWAWFLYLLAWVNVMTASLYATAVRTSTLDIILALFPFSQVVHTIYEVHITGGFNAYCKSVAEPARRLGRLLTLMLLMISFCGVFFHHITYGVLPMNLSRSMMAATCWLVFVRSASFARMLHTFSLSFQSCTPYLVTMLIIMMICSITARDLYHDKAFEEDGTALFSTFTYSFITMFRLFIGEGWHGIMYAAAYNTSSASKYFFMLYTFLVTMLFGQLLIGVIISQYQAVEEVVSTRVFLVHQTCCETNVSNAEEKEQTMDDFLAINHRLYGIHNEINRINIEYDQVVASENGKLTSSYLRIHKDDLHHKGGYAVRSTEDRSSEAVIHDWIEREVLSFQKHVVYDMRRSIKSLVKTCFLYAHHHGHTTTTLAVTQVLAHLGTQLSSLQAEAKSTLERRICRIKHSEIRSTSASGTSLPEGRTAEELLPAMRHIPMLIRLMYAKVEAAIFGLFSWKTIDSAKAHGEFLNAEMNHARSSVTNNAKKLCRVAVYSFATRFDKFEYNIFVDGFHEFVFQAMWEAFKIPDLRREMTRVVEEKMSEELNKATSQIIAPLRESYRHLTGIESSQEVRSTELTASLVPGDEFMKESPVEGTETDVETLWE